MIVSVLAVVFLIVVGFIAFLGYKTVILPRPGTEQQDTEKCSICRERFERGGLILRQIGDHKLLYFCRECVLKLYADIGMTN